MLRLVSYEPDIGLAKDAGLDTSIYLDVIEAYQDLIFKNRATPIYGEISERVFKLYMRRMLLGIEKAFAHDETYQSDPEYRREMWDEVESEFLGVRAAQIESQIRDCLRIAKLVYFEEQFYAEADHARHTIVENSPQLALFEHGRLT